jgi:hypothetical protein
MAKETIGIGTTPNDKKGDSLREAFRKVNANFTELYRAVGLSDTGQITALTFIGSTIATDDSSNIIIDRATTVTSDLTIGGNIVAGNLRTVTSSAGLKQVYFDPATGELVVLV